MLEWCILQYGLGSLLSEIWPNYFRFKHCPILHFKVLPESVISCVCQAISIRCREAVILGAQKLALMQQGKKAKSISRCESMYVCIRSFGAGFHSIPPSQAQIKQLIALLKKFLATLTEPPQRPAGEAGGTVREAPATQVPARGFPPAMCWQRVRSANHALLSLSSSMPSKSHRK